MSIGLILISSQFSLKIWGPMNLDGIRTVEILRILISLLIVCLNTIILVICFRSEYSQQL